MTELPDNSVALVVTSPPYFVGKDYELAVAENDHIPDTYIDFITMLREVFAECQRVLEPGGRIAINVANLGRKPYRSLSSDIIRILQDDLGMLLRGEIVWQKADGASGSVAWGSFRRATNPVLRDITERVILASKGRFNRALSAKKREQQNLPHISTTTTDEFMEATLDLWRIDSESAKRVQHPAPFPVELPRRIIELYTYQDDLVVDPFAGSGSTLVAAEQAGRRAVGYDLEPQYVDAANDRLTQLRQSAAEHLNSPNSVTGYAQASDAGRKVQDIARNALESCKFDIVKERPTIESTGVPLNFLVADQTGSEFFVEVVGTFTTARPGLTRSDLVWKLLAKAHIMLAQVPDSRLLVLTPETPSTGTPPDNALRAVGTKGIFDVITLFDPASIRRLQDYGKGANQPITGFWKSV